METLKPPLGETSIVANNLDSTSETAAHLFQSTIDDVESEDSNTQNSMEQPTTREEIDNKNEINKDHGEEPLQLEQTETSKLSEKTEDEKDETTGGVAIQEDRQQVKHKPQKDERNEEQQYDDTTEEQCENQNETQSDEEDKLLESEADDGSDKDDNQGDDTTTTSKIDNMSMEQENALLKSEDEGEDEDEDEKDQSNEKGQHTHDNGPKTGETQEYEKQSSPKSENRNKIKTQIIDGVHKTSQWLKADKDNLTIDSDTKLNQEQKSSFNIDDTEKKHRDNLRILYQFDLDDDSSDESFKSMSFNNEKNSPTNETDKIFDTEENTAESAFEGSQPLNVAETVGVNNDRHQSEPSPAAAPVHDDNSAESLAKRSPKCWSDKKIDNKDDSTNQSFESVTQHSISETTDIKDVSKEQVDEKNVTTTETEKVWEDELMPTSTQLTKEQTQGVIKDSPDKEDELNRMKRWNSFDNSYQSNEFLHTNNQTNNKEHSKLNGDHHHQDEAEYHDANTNGSVTSDTNTIKSLNTSKESPQHVRPTHSPLHLPQNEEARTAFHSETNPELFCEKQESEAYDSDHENDSDNESHLKISEEKSKQQPKDSEDNVDEFPQHISSPPENTISAAVPVNEDEASRSSVASSVSYSTTTSSSQQLVIDHPMDDVKEEKVKPLKISLKRKLSYSSDDGHTIGPQQKQQHLNDEYEELNIMPQVAVVSMLSPVRHLSPLQKEMGKEHLGQGELTVDTRLEQCEFGMKQELEYAPIPVFKSLLLQQLEKPIMVPTTPKNQLFPLPLAPTLTDIPPPSQPPPISIMFPLPTPMAPTPTDIAPPAQPPPIPIMNVPLTNTGISAILETVPPPAAQLPVTKYLCFKCKTGSFDSFVALTEHQATCSQAHRLFPFNPPPATTNTAATLLTQRRPVIDNKSLATIPSFHSKQTTPASVSAPKKRYYECSSCNTFHENWNLFLHIREKHNRHMCLYCARFFPTAEKLALHLEIKHDLEQTHFNSEEALRKSIPQVETYPLESRFLMCCTCEHVFMEHELFSQHDCAEYMKPCALCGQKGRHTSQCKAHPDSKRFSKLKKKKDKAPSPLKAPGNERTSVDFNIPPPPAITANPDAVNPTIISNPNSILNCDSGHVVQRPPPNALHSEDSNSSSNMVIDESCHTNHLPPPQPAPSPLDSTVVSKNDVMCGPLNQHQALSSHLAPVVTPDEQTEVEDTIKMRLAPLKLVVPKLKLRVPKEFQKSVDDALSSSETDDGDGDGDVDGEEEAEKSTNPTDNQNDSEPINETSVERSQSELFAITTPASSQDRDIERNSATESATEAGNSQDDAAYVSGCATKATNSAVSLDDDDSLDEPNSSLVRIMQEIERTKMDIKRTKKTSFRQNKPFADPRQATLSQSSNRTTDHNWSPTPPASPNSRWFTPRRATVSQSEGLRQHRLSFNQSDENQQQQSAEVESQAEQQEALLPPVATPPVRPHVAQERRDTIGSDMMDIDETITAQPTQTIYRDESRPDDSEPFNTSMDSADNEPMDASQTTDNEEMPSNEMSTLQTEEGTSQLLERESEEFLPSPQETDGNNETPDDMDISLTQTTDNEENNAEEDQEEYGDIDVCGSKEQTNPYAENPVNDEESLIVPPSDGIDVANEDTLTVDLQLDQALDKYEIVDFVRICLKTIYPMCLYCNHARRIAVNGKGLVLHMIGEHRFTATVDSITAEELQADTIVSKLKSFLPELEDHYFNSNSYCTYGNGAFTNPFNERIYECFQCRVVASTHKELYLHNRKMHLRTAILCFMCRANFYSFSEILCHICPGAPNKLSIFDVKFRCCLCNLDNIPSPFRLMVHLRKKHFACDVCLEDCREQSKLSSHVWKHKLHHLCYRCGIAYRNKQDITKHLFWKHGTESTICKKCLQKKWPHVYHFCIPPQNFVCEVCNLCFTKAMYLRVHKRIHTGDFRYPCVEDECEEKFVSRRLLLKHAAVHLPTPVVEPEPADTNKENLDAALKEDVKPEAMSMDIKTEVKIKKEPFDETELIARKLKPETDEHKETKKVEKSEEKITSKSEENKSTDVPRKKRKKSKRSKGLLEDLNLAAPNLSESDSSDGDDSDSDSKTRSEIDAMPRVMLSPPSEAEGDEENAGTANAGETAPGKVLQIWQNFLKTQKSPTRNIDKTPEPKDPSSNVMYGPVHIGLSDHNYCKLYEPPPPPPLPQQDTEFKKPELEVTSTPETSPVKRKQSKSPRRLSSRRSDASSSSSGSSSSSDSSCSCGSNCSCSSSNSGSSSSSSSSEETDSSIASNASVKKRHRKKSERDRLRKRSESISPLKQANKQSVSEIINIDDDEARAKDMEVRPPSPPKEPLFYESDLETNESETDEEFYDEHPQKLASELLAQKRALLMAQTRLSPSHNYDIVENSRPSTPSLPEEVATNERPKVKVKKKKRDRKSSCKGHLHGTTEEQNAPAQTINSALQIQPPTSQLISAQVLPNTAATLINPITDTPQSTALQYPVAPQTIYAPPPPLITLANEQTFTPRPLTMPPYGGGGSHHRMSEGSSCSDADGSLKRSKRARRPNKFYGYTSDDENIANGPPLMIGTRAFKPQPPPQLTWRKEDLPTPSKSILNNKNKAHRTPKTPANAAANNLFNTSLTSVSTGKKKSRPSLAGGEKSRKRPLKKKDSRTDKKLPPIPTLKIRPSQIGLNTTRNHETPNSETGHYNSSDTSSDDDMSHTTPRAAPSSTSSFNNSTATLISNIALPILPSQPPPPPTPQTKAFNHRIPPALLPNPDFATLHYFKANNIRYPIRPPAGARQAREGESVYCYCRCPYDEVSEMIACDGENCLIEWFHFECVGIMVAPQGKWFCAECRPKYSEELYPSTIAGQHSNV